MTTHGHLFMAARPCPRLGLVWPGRTIAPRSMAAHMSMCSALRRVGRVIMRLRCASAALATLLALMVGGDPGAASPTSSPSEAASLSRNQSRTAVAASAALARAKLSCKAEVTATGRLRVRCTTNAHRVLVRYRLGRKLKVKALKVDRTGSQGWLLPAGAATVTARTVKTKKLRATTWIHVRPGAAAPVTPTPTPTSGTTSTTPSASPSGEDVAAEVLRLVNVARTESRWCGTTQFAAAAPLSWNEALGAAARGHASDMAARDYFSHTSLSGDTPADRAHAAGYVGAVGENIAAGYPTAQAVVAGWLTSPGHCANIMSDYDTVGVGHALATNSSYSDYWVADFGIRG